MTSVEGNEPKQIVFPIEYSSSASNVLIVILFLIFIPLIAAPLVIIPFNLVTAGLMAVLLLALAFGIYVFRGGEGNKKARLTISPGDARVEGSGVSPLAIRSKGLSVVNSKTLRYSSFALFETKLYFANEDDCEKARTLIKSYY
ncbi:MAG: hypothetical protein ACYCQJ_04110 [Nitrososphaerales archaeon]